MTDLLPRIVPGRRYRLNIRPNGELRCPHCGALGLRNSTKDGLVVVVEDILTGEYECSGPGGCGHVWPVAEGWYAVRRGDDWLGVPWAFLEPIEGENYEEGV